MSCHGQLRQQAAYRTGKKQASTCITLTGTFYLLLHSIVIKITNVMTKRKTYLTKGVEPDASAWSPNVTLASYDLDCWPPDPQSRCLRPQSVVVPSGEHLRGRGRHGVVCRWHCVIHAWLSALEVSWLGAILIHFTFTFHLLLFQFAANLFQSFSNYSGHKFSNGWTNEWTGHSSALCLLPV